MTKKLKNTEATTSITFCTSVYLLGTAECCKTAILYLVQSYCTVFLRMLAEGLCRIDDGIAILDHNTYYNETNQTTASSLHELTRDVYKS